jgi:PAS domain S-box-containing protein
MNDEQPARRHFSAAWLQLWAESTQDYSIFALSTEGIVMSWNPGGRSIQGYEADEIIGRKFSLFYPEGGKRRERQKPR